MHQCFSICIRQLTCIVHYLRQLKEIVYFKMNLFFKSYYQDKSGFDKGIHKITKKIGYHINKQEMFYLYSKISTILHVLTFGLASLNGKEILIIFMWLPYISQTFLFVHLRIMCSISLFCFVVTENQALPMANGGIWLCFDDPSDKDNCGHISITENIKGNLFCFAMLQKTLGPLKTQKGESGLFTWLWMYYLIGIQY